MSDVRPPWVPDHIKDGDDLRNYLGTAGAILDKARWAAREYITPGLLARTDQVQAHVAHKRDGQLRKGLSDE